MRQGVAAFPGNIFLVLNGSLTVPANAVRNE